MDTYESKNLSYKKKKTRLKILFSVRLRDFCPNKYYKPLHSYELNCHEGISLVEMGWASMRWDVMSWGSMSWAGMSWGIMSWGSMS